MKYVTLWKQNIMKSYLYWPQRITEHRSCALHPNNNSLQLPLMMRWWISLESVYSLSVCHRLANTYIYTCVVMTYFISPCFESCREKCSETYEWWHAPKAQRKVTHLHAELCWGNLEGLSIFSREPALSSACFCFGRMNAFLLLFPFKQQLIAVPVFF